MLSTPGRPSVGRYAPSPTPGKFGASMRGGGDPGKKIGFNPNTPKNRFGGATSTRSGSALGDHTPFDEDGDNTPIGMARTSDGSQGSIPDLSSTMRAVTVSVPGYAEQEVERLRKKLEERDKQLKEQAASLAEMENSLTELQSLLPGGGGNMDRGGLEDADATQLRALLREKNDKIAMLTAEFDAHRADFRSTIDTLELASTETERVYERRVEDLLQEIRELHDRSEDVESVAQQLKQLEELVQELEEGLEDARRGEAEARGEVEFLRGEVERGRSELRREREKAAAALKGAGAAVVDAGIGSSGSKEVEQRDDEIRGLKAIIHSLSRDAVPENSSSNSDSNRRSSMRRNGSLSIKSGGNQSLEDALEKERQERERLEREIKDLQGLVERKTYREEELEREMDRLRKGMPMGQRASAGTLGSGSFSEKTVIQSKRSSGRDSKGTVISWRVPSPDIHRHGGLETMHEGDTNSSSDADGSVLWCEICETGGHDILTCTNMFGGQQATPNGNGTTPSGSPSKSRRTGRDAVMEGLKGLSASPHLPDAVVAPLSPGKKAAAYTPPKVAMPNPNDMGPVPGKSSGVVDADKWCALCERDGHESVDCPFEDAF
jgi:CLIP1 zinc knuckle